jgi:hypothetical protein
VTDATPLCQSPKTVSKTMVGRGIAGTSQRSEKDKKSWSRSTVEQRYLQDHPPPASALPYTSSQLHDPSLSDPWLLSISGGVGPWYAIQ